MKCNIEKANKLAKEYQVTLETIRGAERNNQTYSYYAGEEPVIPEYDFAETQRQIDHLCDKIVKIRHAVNLFNVSTMLPKTGLTVDAALVKMSMLHNKLTRMLQATRIEAKTRGSSLRGVSEFKVRNFDVEAAKAEYDQTFNELTTLQQELNEINFTHEIEIPID